MPTHIPDTPPPIHVSRYDRFYTPEDRRDLQENVIGDLADEIFLVRALFYRLAENSQNDRTIEEHTRTVNMMSRTAYHLARLLRTRQALLAKKAEPDLLRELSESLGIRSSENENDIFLLKNPVRLTPQQWRDVQPLLPPQPPPTSRGRPSALIRKALVRPKKRRATRPSAASQARRVEKKKMRGETKRQRQTKTECD